MAVGAVVTSAKGVQSQTSNQLIHLIQSRCIWPGKDRHWKLQCKTLILKSPEGSLTLARSQCGRSRAQACSKPSVSLIARNSGDALSGPFFLPSQTSSISTTTHSDSKTFCRNLEFQIILTLLFATVLATYSHLCELVSDPCRTVTIPQLLPGSVVAYSANQDCNPTHKVHGRGKRHAHTER